MAEKRCLIMANYLMVPIYVSSLLVPPYGNKYRVPSCAVPLTSIILHTFNKQEKIVDYMKGENRVYFFQIRPLCTMYVALYVAVHEMCCSTQPKLSFVILIVPLILFFSFDKTFSILVPQLISMTLVLIFLKMRAFSPLVI